LKGWVQESDNIAGDTGFNAKIFRCIDDALLTLGADVRDSLYFQIQEKYKIPKEKLANHPLELIEHLEIILGATGSVFVERLVVREIRKSFGLPEKSGASLQTIIAEARSKFLDVADRDFQ